MRFESVTIAAGEKARCKSRPRMNRRDCAWPRSAEWPGGQVARDRDWHGPAHLMRASDESARGGAMSKGEQPQALGQSLQKSFATRWAPVGGLLFWGFGSPTGAAILATGELLEWGHGHLR